MEPNTTDFSEYKYKHFTNLITTNVINMYDAVCVKECPVKGQAPECMTNNDVSSCPTS